MKTATLSRGIPFDQSKFKNFDHFVLDLLFDSPSDEELDDALKIVQEIFNSKENMTVNTVGVKSLSKTIAVMKRYPLLNKKLEKFLKKLKDYLGHWKSYHKFILLALFNQQFIVFVIRDKQILRYIITSNQNKANDKELEETVEAIIINIMEVNQLLRFFLQWQFLYLTKVDKKTALSFTEFKFEMKEKGKNLNEIEFSIGTYWELLEKINFIMSKLFQFYINDDPEDDLFRKARNSMFHSDIIMGTNEDNVSILEENVRFIKRKPNRYYTRNLNIDVNTIDLKEIEKLLLVWVGFLVQIFSVLAYWNDF